MIASMATATTPIASFFWYFSIVHRLTSARLRLVDGPPTTKSTRERVKSQLKSLNQHIVPCFVFHVLCF